jgi:3-phenylpropionate/trans-cinnamate dioxygenase ferredoxin component
MTRLFLGVVSDFAPSSVVRVDVPNADGTATGESRAVAVARIGDDFYAIGDRCSHANVSLSEGTLWDDECELECPQHGSAFSLRTGEPQSFPATRPVAVYAVERDGDDLYLALTTPDHS